MRVLLDEHISPALITRLAEVGVYAQSVPHVGLAGRADHEIWQYALDHDFAVVTTNARDFIELLDVDVHPGLIVLRESGLSRDEQHERTSPTFAKTKPAKVGHPPECARSSMTAATSFRDSRDDYIPFVLS